MTWTIRKATEDDIPKIMAFVDIHLRNDWLVRVPFLKNNLEWCYLIFDADKLIAYGICRKGVLVNLLVRPDYRGRGVGRHFIEVVKPQIIRSKTDQSTGDPTEFYQKLGYEVLERAEGKKHIKIMQRIEDGAVDG